MPSLASGTFAQTAASTAMTAPDYGLKNKKTGQRLGLLYLLCVKLYKILAVSYGS